MPTTTTTKKNGRDKLLRFVAGVIVILTIPLMLTVRGQDQRYQGRVDSLQDSVLSVVVREQETLGTRLTGIEHFHIRKEQFDKAQAQNTITIMKMLGAKDWEIEAYPDAEGERGSDAENTVRPFGPVVPAAVGDSAGISRGSG